MIRTSLLTSGATVLIEQVEHTETASIGFWLLTGSRDENDAETGISHFLEHMLFKGTERRNAFQIAQEIDRVGGMLNAFTEKEFTCYYCTLPGEHILLAAEIILEMLFQSTLDQEEIEKEKRVIINEILASDDIPEELAYNIFLLKMWDNHPLARKITGESSVVMKVSRDHLIDFHKKWYLPSNMIVSVAGNFDSEALLNLLENQFPGDNHGATQKNRFKPDNHNSWDYISGRFSQVHIYTGLSFPIPGNLEQLYHFLVFSTLFGESMSSRLFQNIREKMGVCYSIYSMRTFFEDLTLWSVYASTELNTTPKLIRALDMELRSVLEQNIMTEEIDNAITHLVGGVRISKDDMESRMKRMVRHFVMGGEIHDIPETIEILQGITRKDVITFLDTTFTRRFFNLTAYGTKRLHRQKKEYFTFLPERK